MKNSIKIVLICAACFFAGMVVSKLINKTLVLEVERPRVIAEQQYVDFVESAVSELDKKYGYVSVDVRTSEPKMKLYVHDEGYSFFKEFKTSKDFYSWVEEETAPIQLAN